VAPKEKGPKRWKRSRISGPYIPYGLFQTKGETCAKCGSDRFRNVDLYKFHAYIQTNKHSSLYIRYLKTDPDTPYIQSWKLRLSDEDKYFNFDDD